MEKKIHHIDVEAVRGNIASQPGFKAIVNAANAELRIGGGVAGAIHRAAGPGLEEECRSMAPIKPGEAVITGAHKLPNQHVIHCLGPVYGRDKPEAELLARCYRNALNIANQNIIDSIAFPAISTGAFGYPLKPAAEITMHTIKEMAPELAHIRQIRMVLHTDDDLHVFETVLESIH
ncbi:MAG: macro domain-containing protein [Balneolales bacterium]